MAQADHIRSSAARLTRRTLGLGIAGTLLARPATAMDIPAGRKISCRIMRGGADIGCATYAFDRQADTLTVGIAIDLRVRLGFITMFRYAHANTERWSNDRLLQFDARTDDNGKPNFATARWTGSGYAVTGSRTAPYTAPPNALGTSYWNPRTLTDPLINSQNGRLLNITLTDAGASQAILSTGRTVAATEYRMTGDLRMNLWYDAGQNWAGLQYYAHDGSILTYERA